MKKNSKQPRKDFNQHAKELVDLSLDKLNAAADAQAKKEKPLHKDTKDKQ
jgi:hypothetical protein